MWVLNEILLTQKPRKGLNRLQLLNRDEVSVAATTVLLPAMTAIRSPNF